MGVHTAPELPRSKGATASKPLTTAARLHRHRVDNNTMSLWTFRIISCVHPAEGPHQCLYKGRPNVEDEYLSARALQLKASLTGCWSEVKQRSFLAHQQKPRCQFAAVCKSLPVFSHFASARLLSAACEHSHWAHHH